MGLYGVHEIDRGKPVGTTSNFCDCRFLIFLQNVCTFPLVILCFRRLTVNWQLYDVKLILHPLRSFSAGVKNASVHKNLNMFQIVKFTVFSDFFPLLYSLLSIIQLHTKFQLSRSSRSVLGF